jgi:glucuronoarabinoxylan endo-1,4-beta-xylanase
MAGRVKIVKNRRLSLLGRSGGALLGLSFLACGPVPEEFGGGSESLAFEDGEAGVDLTTALQPITGFGASSAWTETDIAEDLADQLFSVEDGIGLSLLRVRIAPRGDTDERKTAKKAVERGARVWAAPWSPPKEWKDSGSTNGGSLLVEHYQDWADQLASFAQSMSDAGTPLMMLSAQNEPNYTTTQWETCTWSAEALVTFVRDHLGPALADVGVSTPVLGPETQDWKTLAGYANPLLEDEIANGYIGAIATHGYGKTKAFSYPAPAENGKEFWLTEIDDGAPEGTAFDPGMASGLTVAKLIHEALTVASVNAWHYWWITGNGPSNGAITADGVLTRRAYVMGNFSKFVRPGFVRVEATASPQLNVFTSAFRDEAGTRVAIVAINANATDIAQRFVVAGGSVDAVIPWITSDELALAPQAQVELVDGAFDFVLPPSSVTTFSSDLSDLGAPTPGDDEERPDYVPPRSTETGCACRVPSGDKGTGAGWLALIALWVGSRARSRGSRNRQ